MRLNTPMRISLGLAGSCLLVGICGLLLLNLMFSRTPEFRAQAQAGQPIVRAIEDFRKDTGNYPTSLADLVPKYLPALPEMADLARHKYDGWNYERVTNGGRISCRLSYYMGRGGVVYEPPVWYGIDEGRKRVLFRKQ